MVETAESARIKLFKSIENLSTEKLGKPLMFMNDFLRPDLHQQCTLLDVVSGRLDHVNLKHVSQLESKLSSLYKELIRLHSLLTSDKLTNHRLCSGHMATVVRERLNTQLLRSCVMMKTCSDDLLSLSLLYPSAPWPALRRSIVKDVSVEEFMSYLPPLPRSKSQDVHHLVNAVIKVCNYRHHMMDKEMKSLREEVKFHQAVYELQLEYSHSLLGAVRDGYSAFEKSASEVIVKPLSGVLEAYKLLKSTAGEDALRDFLSAFKDNEELFSEAVEKLTVDLEEGQEQKNGAFTAFGEEFMKQLDSVVSERQRQRDKMAKQKQELKTEQEQLDDELRSLLRDIENDRIEEKIESAKTEEENNIPVEGPSDMKQVKSGKKYLKSNLRQSQSDMNIKDERVDSSPEKDDSFENEKDSDKRLGRAKTDRTPQSKISSLKSMASKPPAHGTSLPTPKPSYKPNLIVPNRTLRLRRAGSLSRIPGSTGAGTGSDTDNPHHSQEQSDDKCVSESVSKLSIRRRSESPSMSKLPSARKAPFK